MYRSYILDINIHSIFFSIGIKPGIPFLFESCSCTPSSIGDLSLQPLLHLIFIQWTASLEPYRWSRCLVQGHLSSIDVERIKNIIYFFCLQPHLHQSSSVLGLVWHLNMFCMVNSLELLQPFKWLFCNNLGFAVCCRWECLTIALKLRLLNSMDERPQ